METANGKAQKSKKHYGRKLPKRKIITPPLYGILSREDLRKAAEIFKALRQERALSK